MGMREREVPGEQLADVGGARVVGGYATGQRRAWHGRCGRG